MYPQEETLHQRTYCLDRQRGTAHKRKIEGWVTDTETLIPIPRKVFTSLKSRLEFKPEKPSWETQNLEKLLKKLANVDVTSNLHIAQNFLGTYNAPWSPVSYYPHPSLCAMSIAQLMETPNTLKTKILSSKENIVSFETWAIILMFNMWIWKTVLDQKCIFNVLHLVLQLPANHTICWVF